MVPEAKLEDGVPQTGGWFVVNARETRWWHNELGSYCGFESKEARRAELGINLNILPPGAPMAVYHEEEGEEGDADEPKPDEEAAACWANELPAVAAPATCATTGATGAGTVAAGALGCGAGAGAGAGTGAGAGAGGSGTGEGGRETGAGGRGGTGIGSATAALGARPSAAITTAAASVLT